MSKYSIGETRRRRGGCTWSARRFAVCCQRICLLRLRGNLHGRYPAAIDLHLLLFCHVFILISARVGGYREPASGKRKVSAVEF
jgi:hypothetical protein